MVTPAILNPAKILHRNSVFLAGAVTGVPVGGVTKKGGALGGGVLAFFVIRHCFWRADEHATSDCGNENNRARQKRIALRTHG